MWVLYHRPPHDIGNHLGLNTNLSLYLCTHAHEDIHVYAYRYVYIRVHLEIHISIYIYICRALLKQSFAGVGEMAMFQIVAFL